MRNLRSFVIIYDSEFKACLEIYKTHHKNIKKNETTVWSFWCEFSIEFQAETLNAFTPPHSGGCREIPEISSRRSLWDGDVREEDGGDSREKTNDRNNDMVGVVAQSPAGQKITITHVSLQW